MNRRQLLFGAAAAVVAPAVAKALPAQPYATGGVFTGYSWGMAEGEGQFYAMAPGFDAWIRMHPPNLREVARKILESAKASSVKPVPMAVDQETFDALYTTRFDD